MSSNFTGEIEVKCSHCGHAVSEADPLCPHCGRVLLSDQDARRPGNRSYLMLVTANVLRLRRQWELAEAKVGEVLRQDPANAAAYSVLGDIARDRGRLADAIQWYKIVLQYNPGSTSDRKKLEAVIDEVFSRRRRGLVNRTRGDLGRRLNALKGEMRAAHQLSPIALIVGGILGLILLMAVFAIATGRGQQLPPPETPSRTPSGSFETGPIAAVPQQEELGEAPAPDARPDQFADDLASLEADLLRWLRERARALDPNARVVSVQIDPAQAIATVRLSMPRWWPIVDTRRDILSVAGPLAALAAAADHRISGVQVRCDMRQQGMPDQLAMVAEGDPKQLAKFEEGLPVGHTPEGTAVPAEALFSSVWWHPELRLEAPSDAVRGR